MTLLMIEKSIWYTRTKGIIFSLDLIQPLFKIDKKIRRDLTNLVQNKMLRFHCAHSIGNNSKC